MFQNLDWSVLWNLLLSVVPALVCITVHEYCHGLVALRLGDTTARDMGRLSLNPLKHIDFFGLLMMAAFGFGWAKPVPIDMRRFRNPKRGMALTAVAGPVSNLLLAALTLFVYGLLWPYLKNASGAGKYLYYGIYRTAYISTAFAVFNVIPIPPLDGSKVLFSLISDEAYYKLMRYEKYGMLILFALILTGVLDGPLGTAVNFVFGKLLYVAQFGSTLLG